MKDYPARGLQSASGSGIGIAMYRSALEQFAAGSATSVSVPSITGALNFWPPCRASLAYSGMTIQDLRRQIAPCRSNETNFYGQHATGRQGR